MPNPSGSIDDFEIATAEWVYWFNSFRSHGTLGGAAPHAYRSKFRRDSPHGDELVPEHVNAD
ncbi:hypothetical protein BSP239C_04030 [Brevibacterium sp. 239c]|uniref:IS3 family transposase n=1 Tax=Brevibacterium sp. 239c TaxID=1965356 RepID=UPI000C4907EE|nr:IS3 family transposase [Brevibacterium sp. 239c]SMY05011.1 hypothetical protein BSP239C_04030 [Brevibacterium sp. 239c]